MTLAQVREIMVALNPATPSYVSVLAGRIADTGIDPWPLLSLDRVLAGHRKDAPRRCAVCGLFALAHMPCRSLGAASGNLCYFLVAEVALATESITPPVVNRHFRIANTQVMGSRKMRIFLPSSNPRDL
jgi:hypothetical protein